MAEIQTRHCQNLHHLKLPAVRLLAAAVGLAISIPALGLASGEKDEPGEARLLQNIRQLTFQGNRSGEGYFGPQGRRIVFQSEREPGNPFYQIYWMDLENGDTARVSPGHGKTTCGWIHPHQDKILFASTHDDPDARRKQKEELEFRASGRQRRYSWDYDEHYELYEAGMDGGQMRRLTNALGYDAEGSWSPDGRTIVFASNRHAYSQPLSDRDREIFEVDKSLMVDLYRMKADGSGLQRLTDVKGYDGGPFFSPDGKQICWRRFSEDGATAEIYLMNSDGSNQRPITRMGAMSWAPFFHPSGRYLIFATNRHGFGNFELYLVDAQGELGPVRVTYTDGFDGLASFSPDGRTLSWTSNRSSNNQSQLFVADWNHQAALALLRLSTPATPLKVLSESKIALPETSAAIRAEDLRSHVAYLASEPLQGRLTGSPGERQATAYLASFFESLGLLPAGEEGSYFQDFEFTAAVQMGSGNKLTLAQGDQQTELAADQDWRPLAFSRTGSIEASEVAFAGYGIVAPEAEDQPEYDSYVHLDVQGKWVVVLRFLPDGITPERRQHLARYASLRYKAMVARDRGARGLIVASGPHSQVREQLVKLSYDASMSGTSVAIISVTDAIAARLLEAAEKDLGQVQSELDSGEAAMGFALPDLKISAIIDLTPEKRVGRNVLALLPASDQPGASAVAIGAHLDHLGRGQASGSLAKENEKGQIHPGADDNASGVAGLMEIAQYLADLKSGGQDFQRDLLFAGWSGEELGLLGSNHFVQDFSLELQQHGRQGHSGTPGLQPAIVAYLNLDMIGRLRDKLVVQGVGSSSIWPGLIEQRNAPVGLALTIQNDSYLPTDATSFYMMKVPVLSAFTGSHEDYHSPRDTAEKINYEGAQRISRFMALIARDLAKRDSLPDYVAMKAPEEKGQRAGLRAYLGTIPDYAQGEVKGLKISGVSQGGPADQAGLKGGDLIVEMAGKKIENIYDYTYAIDALKIGEPVQVVVVRDGKRLTLEITPASRQ